MHPLFKNKKNFKLFYYYYTKNSFFNRDRKQRLKNHFLSTTYSFTDNEIQVFKNLFNDDDHAAEIINEVVEYGKKALDDEDKRIKAYQKEIPLAQKNVKIIEEAIIGGKEKYKSKLKGLNVRLKQGEIGFIYQEEFDLNHAILQYLSLFSMNISTLNLQLAKKGIENENYFIRFSAAEYPELITFLYQFLVPETIHILGLPLEVIIDNCRLNGVPLVGSWPILSTEVYKNFSLSMGYGIGFNQGNFIARPRDIYSEDNVRTVINELKTTLELENDLDLAVYLYHSYKAPLRIFYNNRMKILKSIDLFPKKDDFNKYKKDRREYIDKAVEHGFYKTKWKNEMKLYRFVKELYPSAVYQFRSEWLGKQSLDIYIPEYNLGIEYQGIQHYEEIDFFGGKKGFEDRIYLDNQKREKCKKNNVTLLEWKYDDITTKKRISNRINEIVSDVHK